MLLCFIYGCNRVIVFNWLYKTKVNGVLSFLLMQEMKRQCDKKRFKVLCTPDLPPLPLICLSILSVELWMSMSSHFGIDLQRWLWEYDDKTQTKGTIPKWKRREGLHTAVRKCSRWVWWGSSVLCSPDEISEARTIPKPSYPGCSAPCSSGFLSLLV